MINAALGLFADGCSKGSFLGLVPWFQYLKLQSDCSIKKFTVLPQGSSGTSDIPLVLLAVIDDLLRIAGLLAVMYVIYGGVMYATSQGNPDQTSKARSAIINALTGLGVAIIAIALITFLGKSLSK